MAKHGFKFSTKLIDGCELNVYIRSGKKDILSMINTMNSEILDKYKNHPRMEGLTRLSFEKSLDKLEDINFKYDNYFYENNETAKYLTKLYNDIETTIKKVGKFYNNSDAQYDYFDCAFYYNIKIGEFEKPYQLTK